MREYLRWIHLSDVHFKWSDKFKQEDALTAVRRDVVKRAQHGFQPDLILVTGDLAYTGAAAEYGPVTQFLGELANELRLSRRNILVCPGNHDVDRSRCPVVREGCVLSLRSISDTTEFLCSEELAHIKTRQSGYDEFVAGFYAGNVALQYDPTGLHLYREVEIEDVIVSILAVNSSWLCKGGEDDQGKLQVGFSVVERFVEEQKGPNPHFSILLVHHPFDWLTQFEADPVETLACRNFDLVLRGHLHKTKTRTFGLGPYGERCLVSAAGAVLDTSQPYYEYTLGFLDITNNQYTIENRIFLIDKHEWTAKSYGLPYEAPSKIACLSLGDLLEALESYVPGLSNVAHIAAVLVGIKSDIALSLNGVRGFYSSSLARESESSGGGDLLKVKAMLDFYGPTRVRDVLSGLCESLRVYERELQQWSEVDGNFGATLQQQEREADALALSRGRSGSCLMAALKTHVSEGNVSAFNAMLSRGAAVKQRQDHDFLVRLQSALQSAGQEVCLYELWKEQGGDTDFSLNEFSTLVLNLIGMQRLGLASQVLLACAKRYPEEARQFNATARNLASEAGSPTLYEDFTKLVAGKGK